MSAAAPRTPTVEPAPQRGHGARTVLWVGLLLVVGLFVAWTWQWSAGGGTVAMPEAARGPSSPSVADLGPRPSVPPAPADGTDREPADVAAGRPAQTLRVVDELGAPVVDAEVAWSDTESDASTPHDDVEEEFAAQPRLRTASDGTVLLPGAQRTRFVLARKADAFGCGEVTFDPFEPMPELTLRADRTLHARVVGPDGTARASVPVLVRWLDFESPWRSSDGAQWLRSDEQGPITVWHAQTLDFWDRAAPAVELSAQVLGAEATIVRVPLREPPPVCIDLPCPAHGALRVRAFLRDGRPCPWPLGCRLDLVGETPPLQESWPVPRGMAEQLLIPAVALARDVRVNIAGFPAKTGPGPTADRGEAVTELVLDHRSVVVTARLLQPDGAPLAESSVSLDGPGWSWVVTDAEGRVTFRVEHNDASVSFHCPSLDLAATAPLPALSSVDRLDLGDVTLRTPDRPLLAAGHVTDAATGGGVVARIHLVGEGQRVDRTVATDGGGRFELHQLPGETCGDRLDLWVEQRGFAAVRITVPRGARDVSVTLRRLPRLRATLQFDPDIQLLTMDCELRHGDDRTHPIRQDERPGRVQCTFELPDGELPADFVFVLEGSDEQPPLLHVPVAEWQRDRGGYTLDLDLRGRFENVVVRAFLGGEPIELDQLWVRPLAEPGTWSDISHGQCHGCTARRGATFDAIALAPTGFPVRVQLGPGENRIDLPPPATIAVQLVGWPGGAEGDVVLHQLTFCEPLLSELAAAGVLDESIDDRARPRTPADWQDMDTLGDGSLSVPGDELTFPVDRRGSYLLLPCVTVHGRQVPLLAAAVEVEVTTPGQRLDVLLRVDPEQVRAAAR